MSLSIRTIDHVQVTVPSELEDQAIAFYQNIMELSRIEKPEPLKSRGGAWFQLADIQLHLSPEPTPNITGSKRHICYLVDDLNAAQKHFEAHAIEITDESTEPYGLKRFFIHDPAGNRVEIGART